MNLLCQKWWLFLGFYLYEDCCEDSEVESLWPPLFDHEGSYLVSAEETFECALCHFVACLSQLKISLTQNHIFLVKHLFNMLPSNYFFFLRKSSNFFIYIVFFNEAFKMHSLVNITWQHEEFKCIETVFLCLWHFYIFEQRFWPFALLSFYRDNWL